jgi:flagellar hook-length control protein FliK
MDQTSALNSIKQSKLNSSTYLFSNIIKVINKNTLDESSLNSSAESFSSSVVDEDNPDSSESLEQLIALAQNKSNTDDTGISLNNLLIPSNSNQVIDSKQVDNSCKKSSASYNLTSALSDSDPEKLFQTIAASLLQLNILSGSIKQVQSVNYSSGSINQNNNDLNKSLDSSDHSGSTITDLVINLSEDSNSTETSKTGSSNQSGVLNFFYKTISSIAANSTNNVSPENAENKLPDSYKTNSANQEVSTEAKQLAASLINLYQNNNRLVINVNSGDDNIKIEISGNIANLPHSNKVGQDDIINAQNQKDNSINTNQQSVPEKTKNQRIENILDNGAVITDETVRKAQNSIIPNTDEMLKLPIVNLQTSINIIADNITIPSYQNNNISPASKSGTTDTASLKGENKEIVTVSSKINTNPQGANIKSTDGTKTQFKKSGIDNLKISNNSEAINKITGQGIEIKTSDYSKTETTIKNYARISDNNEARISNNIETKVLDNNEVKYSENQTGENTEVKVSPATIANDSDKSTFNISMKTNYHILNTTNESEQKFDTQNTAGSTVQNFNTTAKEVKKEFSANDTQKTNQINQADVINCKSNDSSREFLDDSTSVGNNNPQRVLQVLNNNQGNSSYNQLQKKPSDDNKNSDIKTVEQIANNFSIKTTDSVKEKFLNQTSPTDSAAKTIKITQITKEISTLIQQNNSKSVVLQLKPESLGKIKVTLNVNDNSVNARVEVDTEAVRQIVQNSTTELRQSLSSNGMQLSSLSVNVSSDEQKPNQLHAQKKKSGYHTTEKRIEDNPSFATLKSMGYNTYEYLI